MIGIENLSIRRFLKKENENDTRGDSSDARDLLRQLERGIYTVVLIVLQTGNDHDGGLNIKYE